jgi:uncharacterized membrane protein YcaP (DUF421 family)
MDKNWLMSMFYLGVPVLEKIIRPLIIYVFLVVGLRLAGKRELAQLNPLDLVVLLTLSNTVQNAIIGEDSTVIGGIIGATTLLVANYIVLWFLYRRERLQHLIEGDAEALIDGGVMNKKLLQKELITVEQLEEAAHKQGFSSLADIDKATLEPGGALSFISKKPAPETARHQEILDGIDRLSRELADMRRELASLKQ